MRPRGEIRAVLSSALAELPSLGFTWRDAAVHTGVGFAAARVTLENMARAGEVVRAGTLPVPGAARPMVRYRSPQPQSAAAAGPAGLEHVLRSWAEFV
jgi:hypothetical protein